MCVLVFDAVDDCFGVLDLGIGRVGFDSLDDGASAAAGAVFEAFTRRARSASLDTVCSLTSSMMAIGALSPLRGTVLMMRV